MLLPLRTAARCSTETEPGLVDWLLDCHERIRRFSKLALTIREAQGAPAADLADAAARVHRYFSVALPLHVADEDLSFEPRLLPFATGEIVESLALMRGQHVVIEERLSHLLPAWERLAREPAALEDLRPLLAERTPPLVALLDEHLRNEEQLLFPFARRHLSAAQMSEIVREMQGRRRPAA